MTERRRKDIYVDEPTSAPRGLRPVIVAALFALAWNGAYAEEPKASRPSQSGCVWRTLADKQVGLELLTQNCDFGFRKIHFESSPKDASVYVVTLDTASGSKESREALIIVFKKKASEKIEVAIRRVAAPLAPESRRRHCRAVPSKNVGLPVGSFAYSYKPDDEDKLVEAAGGEIPDLPCGIYGMDFDSESYFEYHPAENPRHFAFVFIGQDTPLFDEKSIKFLP